MLRSFQDFKTLYKSILKEFRTKELPALPKPNDETNPTPAECDILLKEL